MAKKHVTEEVNPEASGEEETVDSGKFQEEKGFAGEPEAPEQTDAPAKTKKEKKSGKGKDKTSKAAKKPKAPEPEEPEPAPTMSFDADEGTFYESQFSPTKMEVWADSKTGERHAVLEDANGAKMRVDGNAVVRRLMQVLVVQLTEEKRTATFWEMDEASLTKSMNKILQTTTKKGEQARVKFLLDGKNEVVGASSLIHKQVPWSEIKKIVETAIKQSYGTTEHLKAKEGVFHWDYRIPVESKNVSAFLSVERGSNLARGRASINMHARFRTDREDFGGAPCCQNWAGLWGPVSQFFDIKLKRLGEVPLEGLALLHQRNIHMKGTFADHDETIAELASAMDKIKEGVKVANELIDQSFEIPLEFPEMADILQAYDEKVSIPAYVRTAIMERAEKQGEETVWAFSQAVSFIRTHFDLKKSAMLREQRPLVQKLENIAGEVYSLVPVIAAFHEKIGDITFAELITKPKKKAEEQAAKGVTAPHVS